MCGICGILDYNKNSYIEESVLRSMCLELNHRGPDDEGVFIDKEEPSVGLGHRRLSIIDLSPAGHQPMSNEDGTVWLVLNGEIYNYKELRTDLENKGHKFKSNTDTETIVHLYEEYQEDCVKSLRGMFAFAIWDKQNKILLLARDRVGKKPLIYYHKYNNFCFASEFCALLGSGLINKDISFEAINHYLTFGYIPAPLTIYKEVYKLPPAHTLILKNNKVTIKKYWELDYRNKIKITEEEAADETIRLLKEAVKIRLYSDVPLGVFLSGGIDSSTVVALMNQLSSNRIKTFSIGFEEKDYSELKYARNIADRFNTEHHEFIVKPNALEILPLLVERYGEPYADSSCIPTYYVARETRKYVTVALNGDGGDESFAGYERYQAMLVAEMIPRTIKKIASRFSSILPDSVSSKNNLRRIKRFLKAIALSSQYRYIKWVGIFDDVLKKDIYLDGFAKIVNKSDPLNFISPYLDNSSGMSMIDSLLYTDVMTYLPYDLLVKVDITSMANSLEARSPFLDHKLMEYVAKLPAEYKMKRLTKKYLLKKAIKDLVPPQNIHRKKMGFALPVGEWFRNELKGFLSETILSERSLKRGYFKKESIKEMVSKHIQKKADYTFQLWAFLMLELWHQRFID